MQRLFNFVSESRLCTIHKAYQFTGENASMNERAHAMLIVHARSHSRFRPFVVKQRQA